MNYTIPVSGTMFAISHLPLKIMLSCTKVPSTIMVQKFKVKGYRGKPVSLEMYSPRNLAPDMPAMVYFHGGAFGFKASPAHKSWLVYMRNEQTVGLYSQTIICCLIILIL